MASIVLSYTTQDTSTVYSITFSTFLGSSLPRNYVAQSQFNFSTKGVSIVSGPAYQQKRVWAINALVTRAQATTLDALFREWDQDRSKGHPAAINIVDTTFGSTVTTNVVISTAPTFNMLNYDNWDVSLGLTEV